MQQQQAHPLSGVLSAPFSAAKLWWGVGLFSQILGALVGAISVLIEQPSLQVACGVGVVSVLGEGEGAGQLLPRT